MHTHEPDETDDELNDKELPDESDMDESDVVPCAYCGKMIAEEAEWCHHCGKYLSAEDAPAKVPLWIIVGTVLGLLVMLGWILIEVLR